MNISRMKPLPKSIIIGVGVAAVVFGLSHLVKSKEAAPAPAPAAEVTAVPAEAAPVAEAPAPTPAPGAEAAPTMKPAEDVGLDAVIKAGKK